MLNPQIPPHRHIARQTAEHDPRPDDDAENLAKIRHEIRGENINDTRPAGDAVNAGELDDSGIAIVRRHRQNNEGDTARYDTIYDTRDDKRPFDIGVRSTDELHDYDFITGIVNDDADGVENNDHRHQNKNDSCDRTGFFDGGNDCGKTVDDMLIFIVIDIVDNGRAASGQSGIAI